MIALFLKHGASPTAPNKQGVSPSKLANTIANFDVAQFFPCGKDKKA